jgi:hypothetical protein
MAKKSGNKYKIRKDDPMKLDDDNAINTRYLAFLRALCKLYGNQVKSTLTYHYYTEALQQEIKKRQKQLVPSLKDRYEIQKQIIEERLDEISAYAKSVGFTIRFEKFCAEYNLAKDERIILATLFFKRFDDKTVIGIDLLRIVGLIGSCEPLQKIQLIAPAGTLRKSGLIDEKNDRSRDERRLLFEKEFAITKKAFSQITGIANFGELETEDEKGSSWQPSILYLKDPGVSFDNLVLPQEINNSIEEALWQYENGEQVYERYGLKQKLPYGRAVAMLFYGPPGTGKTATSEAIANRLGKKIGFASYDKIYSVWVGGSQKNLVRVFAEAKEKNCVLLFDEADALFAKRIEECHSVDRMNNSMTNLLMQELERTSTLVILTTNREVVIDKAFERRLLLKLKFGLPPAEERAKIWETFLKDCPNLNPDVSFDELGRYPLAGGKIKNVVIKAVMKCAKEDRPVGMSDLIGFAEQESRSGLGKEKNIGFRN